MHSLNKIYYLVSCLLLSSIAHGATITGTVRGPDGSPFMGSFVEVQNNQNKITVAVLSRKDGHYKAENLTPGDYEVRVKAIGYKGETHSGVKITESQNAPIDLALQKGEVKWSDLSIYQGDKLFPDLPGKKELEGRCLACHGFQSRYASVQRDEDGWRDRVQYMRDTMRVAGLTEEGFQNVTTYLSKLFGEDSILPHSPADLPAYKALEQHFSDEAMNIVYVEYKLPQPGRMPWDVNPGSDGKLWIPYYSNVNMVGQLDPATGNLKEFPLPAEPRVAMHSTWEAPDGSVWFTEQANNTLGKLDPKTGKVAEYKDDHVDGPKRPLDAVSTDSETFQMGVTKHTVRVDEYGHVWSSGDPISMFNPKTGKYTEFKEAAYSVALDGHGGVWFTAYNDLVRIDEETLKETKYTPPSGVGAEPGYKWPRDHSFVSYTYSGIPAGIKPNIFTRRIQVDTDGLIWFTEFNVGIIASFDPKTEKFVEYKLPAPMPTPYAFGIDKTHQMWYASRVTDIIGRLDPATGKVIVYPYLHRENTMREFYCDPQGRMWYGSPANNLVGYFYLAK